MPARFWLSLVVAFGLGACALPERPRPDAVAASPIVERCVRAFEIFDRVAAEAGVSDAEAARVDGFPWLRVDRYLASFRNEPMQPAALRAWVETMRERDRASRRVEYANLPASAKQALATQWAPLDLAPGEPASIFDGCAETLQRDTLASPQQIERLRQVAIAPDAYADWMRVVGLYPVAVMPAMIGIRRLEADTQAAFDAPLPVQGVSRTYVPERAGLLEPMEIVDVVDRARLVAAPFGMPRLTGDEARRLLAAYAPTFVVAQASDSDRIGAPEVDANGSPSIDLDDPVVFSRIAYTRVGGESLIQLVYTAWFKSRPATSSFDPLAGPLDGLVWRVTLAADGTPLMFDSMHPCGCYHWFFPTARLADRPRPADTLEEPPLVPQRLPRLPAGAHVVLHVEAGTHYLRRIVVGEAASAGAERYDLRPDDMLRTLTVSSDRTRSFYGPDGIVHASDRPERYLLWPLGIPSAGSMRQWGHHATAFVGRRHFDEPFLIDRYFIRQDATP